MDVEGHEYEVIKGALNLYKNDRIKYSVYELGPKNSYNNFTALIEAYETLLSWDYSLTTMNCDHGKLILLYYEKNLTFLHSENLIMIFTKDNLAAFEKYANNDYRSCRDLKVHKN